MEALWQTDAPLIMDQAGDLYGTTTVGGTGPCAFPSVPGCGILFELDTSGNETVLYSFTGSPSDGSYPSAELIVDQAGNLYGTTSRGGSGNCADGCGTLFELSITPTPEARRPAQRSH